MIIYLAQCLVLGLRLHGLHSHGVVFVGIKAVVDTFERHLTALIETLVYVSCFRVVWLLKALSTKFGLDCSFIGYDAVTTRLHLPDGRLSVRMELRRFNVQGKVSTIFLCSILFVYHLGLLILFPASDPELIRIIWILI